MNSKLYNSLEKSISSSRLFTYKNNNEDIDTLSNYVLNAKISQNFYFLLQNLEVTLRNSIYDSFKIHYKSSDFFYLHETNSFNRYKARQEKHSRECWKMLCGAKHKLRHISSLSDGKIVSELNFGFWTELLTSTDSKYINMWRKIFKDVFPNYIIQSSIDNDKNIIANKINDLRSFRNRIFHYEPIYNQVDLMLKHQEIFEILGWLNKDMQKLNILFDEFKYIKRDKKNIQKKLKKFGKPVKYKKKREK